MSCITITFGDQAENHKGMQIIGNAADKGFDIADLELAKKKFESKGATCYLVDLKLLLDEDVRNKADEAKVLVVKNGVDILLAKSKPKSNKQNLFEELEGLEWDTKAFMYGRVVNKHARYNLCFDDTAQEPDYQDGKGRIIAWNSVPLLKKIKKSLGKFIAGADELAGEGNYYYDVSKTGISFHCDLERKKVIGIRNGNSMPLFYQWFLNSKPVGTKLKIDLDGGDLYVMSEVAKGITWNKKDVYTLRHAAGCEKYTNV
jgi:hypothetical protein